MAASTKVPPDTSSPLTRCDNCMTVFEVPRELVDAADPRVRCGECLTIFDARESLYSVPHESFVAPTDVLSSRRSTLTDGPADRQSPSGQVVKPTESPGKDDALGNGAEDFFATSEGSESASGPASGPASGSASGPDSNLDSHSDGVSVAENKTETRSLRRTSSMKRRVAKRSPDGGKRTASAFIDQEDDTNARKVSRDDLQPAVTAAPAISAGKAPAHGSHRTDSSELLLADANVLDGGQFDLDVTYSDFDLFSDDAALPESSFLDDTRDAIDLDFDQVPGKHDDTINDTLFQSSSEDIERSSNVGQTPPQPGDTSGIELKSAIGRRAEVGFVGTDFEPKEAVEFDFSKRNSSLAATTPSADSSNTRRGLSGQEQGQAQKAGQSSVQQQSDSVQRSANRKPETTMESGSAQAADDSRSEAVAPSSKQRSDKTAQKHSEALLPSRVSKKSKSWILKLFLGLLLLILLAGLWGYKEGPRLANNPYTRPAYSAWCSITQCIVPHRFDVSQLRVLRKNIYSHPTIDKALVINVVIKNLATFDQRYPVLDVTLSDLTGSVVASRFFEPDDYRGNPDGSPISAGSSVDITLEVRDPGKDANSFELMLR